MKKRPVTSLDLAPEEVWRLYNGRSDSENRIAELKNDFGINGFCLDPFYATEAAFSFGRADRPKMRARGWITTVLWASEPARPTRCGDSNLNVH